MIDERLVGIGVKEILGWAAGTEGEMTHENALGGCGSCRVTGLGIIMAQPNQFPMPPSSVPVTCGQE